MQIKILGPGCKNCHKLESRTREVLDELDASAQIDTITDVGEIAAHGILATPGLVVDDEVVVSGRVPSVRELRELFAARTASSTG